MKSKIILLNLIFVTFFSTAQDNIIIYGISQNFSEPTVFNPGGEVESMDLVSINPLTGNRNILFEIEDAKSVTSGSSTYDAGSNQYYFWGSDNSNARIYSLDINLQSTINKPITQNRQVEIEYNYSNGKIYSMELDANDNVSLVELDIVSGTSTLISSLQSINGVAIGNSTFDPKNGLYIGIGGTSNGLSVFAVNVNSGEIVYNFPIGGNTDLILALEYDWTNERLLGLRQTSMPDPNIPFEILIENYLVELDLATGIATDLFAEPAFSGAGVAVGGVGFDQQSQTYITYVGGNFDLGMFNTNTGELINSVSLEKPYYELQIDNLEYAKSLFNPTSTIDSQIGEISISPNPVINELTIGLDEAYREGSHLEIFDINGMLVTSSKMSSATIQISVTDLKSGMYFARIKNSDYILTSKFTKL